MRITDKMRLDWLEGHRVHIDDSSGPPAYTYLDGDGVRGPIRRRGIRKAIDAAIRLERRSSRRPGKGKGR